MWQIMESSQRFYPEHFVKNAKNNHISIIDIIRYRKIICKLIDDIVLMYMLCIFNYHCTLYILRQLLLISMSPLPIISKLIQKFFFLLTEDVLCTQMIFMHPPTSGEAYRDRRLTTYFELWVEIFCVPTCFHMRIPKPCLSVRLSAPREKK